MKKTLMLSAALFVLAVIPSAAHAQLSLFGLKSADKASVTAPAPQVPPAAPATTSEPAASTQNDGAAPDLSVTDTQNQPLSVRRQLVATQLGDILLKLNVLSDKTKTAADRLAQNGIATDHAQTDLSAATLTLAQAKLSIDALTTAANDPKNQEIINLMVDGISYKESVIKTENLLRTARQSIIDSLVSLKAAVNAAATVPAQ